jgi:hypothetical protein
LGTPRPRRPRRRTGRLPRKRIRRKSCSPLKTRANKDPAKRSGLNSRRAALKWSAHGLLPKKGALLPACSPAGGPAPKDPGSQARLSLNGVRFPTRGANPLVWGSGEMP